MLIDVPPMIQPLVDAARAPFTRPDDRARLKPAPGWALEVDRDRFTGEVRCRLQKGALQGDTRVATFRFGHSVDTANAFYRLDDGPARSVGDTAIEAAGKGARFLTANLNNPTNGEVHLPVSALGQANSIAIRPNRRAPARTFSLTGLQATLDAAVAHGCPKA